MTKYIRVTHDDIKNAKRTTIGNPVCRAIRRYGFQGARFDTGGWIHLYKGNHWLLTTCPNIVWEWMLKYLSGDKAEPFRFYLQY